jgi:biopolymer transport protein ExbD
MHKSHVPDPPKEIVLPVTPMLDMAFQLLFFSIFTWNPVSEKEGQMALSLPSKTTPPKSSDPAKADPFKESHKEDLDIPADFTVTILGYNDPVNRGRIRSLTVTGLSGDETFGAERGTHFSQLKERLASVKPGDLKDPKTGLPRVPTVRMAAESHIRWSEVVSVMDVCYKAGFQVSFAKPPDL